MAGGAFRIDHATVNGNATLLEGTVVETGETSSRLEIEGGTRLTLLADSRGKIFGDHVVLERGQSRLDKATGFRVEARGLSVLPETGNSTGRVLLEGVARVEVVALTGSFRILNARGAMVARLPQGRALAFEPQASLGPARITGILENRGGHFLITDETTNVTVEVTGAGLEKQVGRRVEVTGTTDPSATPVSDATQIVRVISIHRLPAGTAAAGAGGAAGGASGIAISGTTIAIIGGVAAAALVGGLAASGNLGNGGAPPVSR